jgi:hypothetical protein
LKPCIASTWSKARPGKRAKANINQESPLPDIGS